MASVSTIRLLVDEALEDRNTTLEAFVAKARGEGKSVREAAGELRFVTGIPISWRTLYRWLKDAAAETPERKAS